jgi:formate dehydrogenase subunit delta
MSPEKLVMMVNQIAAFFAGQAGGHKAEDVADHLRKFWEPRMRRAALAHFRAGGAGLDPLAKAALALLEDPA